jgi:hypothetical protein
VHGGRDGHGHDPRALLSALRSCRGAAAPLALLALGLGCASLISARARAVHEGVVGLGGRKLRTCFGPPDRLVVDRPGGGEVWVYFRPLSEQAPEDVVIEAEISGAPVRRQGPRVVQGDVRVDSAPSSASELLERPVPPSSCRFLFDVGSAGIETLRVSGRTAANLNADERCTVLLEPCLAPTPEATEP